MHECPCVGVYISNYDTVIIIYISIRCQIAKLFIITQKNNNTQHSSSIRGHVGAQIARVNGVYGVNDEIVITSKLVKSIWFFCSVSNFALSKVNFIELVSKT